MNEWEEEVGEGGGVGVVWLFGGGGDVLLGLST